VPDLNRFTNRRPAAPREESAVRTSAQRVYLESELGAVNALPSAGTPLENPYVYDASAREFETMAAQGLVRIVAQRRDDRGSDGLIRRLSFERLR
jgi:hypothetical protein